MDFSSAKSEVRHILTVRSSLYERSNWSNLETYFCSEIFECRIKRYTFDMTLMRFDPLYFLCHMSKS
jgi:hypothetical protein